MNRPPFRVCALLHTFAILPAVLLWLLNGPARGQDGSGSTPRPSGRQSAAPKWGAIDPADLDLTAWAGDPDATAAVLADVGEVYFTNQFELVFKYHRRIKIFTEAAYDDWGTVKIPYYAKSGFQKVEEVEGTTFSRDSQGNLVQSRLDPASLFDEDAANRSWRQVRFTMPALKPGCIIEYRFTIHSRNGTFLRDWDFGTSQPTRFSQFVATIPDNVEYRMVRTGLVSFDRETTEPVEWPSQLDGFERAQQNNIGQTRHTWVMTNVAAIRKEPFITTTQDYIPRIRFQMARWSWPGFEGVDYIKDWETVARDYEGGLGSCAAANGQVGKLTRGLTDPREKMKAIYEYVRRTMVWAATGSPDLCKAFAARQGTSVEIASLLTSMLRKADITAFPLLVSTRGNGKPIDVYPLVSQFDRTMTLAEIDGEEYILDATDPLRPIDLLPFSALNETGFVADSKDPRWIEIPAGLDRTETTVRATLSGAGSIAGVAEVKETGYAALQTRQKLRDETERKYLDRVWLPRLTTATLDSAHIAGRDSADLPLITTLRFSGAGTTGEGAARHVYFEPVLVKATDENPFRNPRRILPVDFGARIERSYTLTLEVPEGYSLETVPDNVNIALPRNAGRLTRRIESTPGQIRYVRELVLTQPRYNREECKALRSCYDRLIALDSEQIVLVAPAAPAGGR